MKEIAAEIEKAIRFAAESDPQMRTEPVGFDVPGTDVNAHFPRHIAADYLEESGRPDEAETLRWYQGPVVLHGERVKKGRYNTRPVWDAYRAVMSHLEEWYPDYTAMHEIDPDWEADTEWPVPEDHTRIHYTDRRGNPYHTEDLRDEVLGPELAHILSSEHKEQHGDGDHDDTLQLLLNRLRKTSGVEPAE